MNSQTCTVTFTQCYNNILSNYMYIIMYNIYSKYHSQLSIMRYLFLKLTLGTIRVYEKQNESKEKILCSIRWNHHSEYDAGISF